MIFKLFKQRATNPAVVGMVLAVLSTLVLFLYRGGLAEAQDPPANNEATGKPTISGTAGRVRSSRVISFSNSQLPQRRTH